MTVVTRFAPSPTGFLHIGGARTALFNWLFARGSGGAFVLRVEDTDKERSTQPAIDAIIEGLDWLGLKPDRPAVFQSARAARHRDVAESLVEMGAAFRCYVTSEELDQRRAHAQSLAEAARAQGLSDPERETAKAQAALAQMAFRSPYRDGLKPPAPHAPFVVRLRAPDAGECIIDDAVQGQVRTPATEIDDLILLRSDAAPTYMLAVVVDDQDMGVTHVIRGDDHLTNAARQAPIIDAMGWRRPTYAHVPMIHGQDGAKLSKRHGALAVQAYRDMGFLPEALLSYLMRLGWSPGHDDIMTAEQAASKFRLDQIGKAPARLDRDKLAHINAHFMKAAEPERLIALAECLRPRELAQANSPPPPPEIAARLVRAAPILRNRAKTVLEFIDQSGFLGLNRPIALDERGEKMMNHEARGRLGRLHQALTSLEAWEEAALAGALKAFAEHEGIAMGKVGPPLRAALTGAEAAPDLSQILYVLGRDESLARIADVALRPQ